MDNSDSRVYTLLGDGELQEGLVWEAIMSAAHYKLSNLVAIVDYNKLQIDGNNDDVMSIKPLDKKFESFGWNVEVIDGHNFGEIEKALNSARNTHEKPTVIIANTVKGKGVSFMENNAGWHGTAPSIEERNIALKEVEEMRKGCVQWA